MTSTKAGKNKTAARINVDKHGGGFGFKLCAPNTKAIVLRTAPNSRALTMRTPTKRDPKFTEIAIWVLWT